MKKRLLARIVGTTFAAVLVAGFVSVACSKSSSPTAPEVEVNEPAASTSDTVAPGAVDTVAPGGDTSAAAKGGQPKVQICHQEGNGSYHILTIAGPAVPAHEAHGDWRVSAEVCDGVDNECNGVVDDGGSTLCDNALFCDGAETCTGAAGCQAGTPPDCSDEIPCTFDSCNEASDSCDHVPDDSLCDNGLFCDGRETCSATLGCQPGTPPNCNDGVSCTSDSCNEASDSCRNQPVNARCDNGVFCDGPETCHPSRGCQPGSDPCPPFESCEEASRTCVSPPVRLVCTCRTCFDSGVEGGACVIIDVIAPPICIRPAGVRPFCETRSTAACFEICRTLVYPLFGATSLFCDESNPDCPV